MFQTVLLQLKFSNKTLWVCLYSLWDMKHMTCLMSPSNKTGIIPFHRSSQLFQILLWRFCILNLLHSGSPVYSIPNSWTNCLCMCSHQCMQQTKQCNHFGTVVLGRNVHFEFSLKPAFTIIKVMGTKKGNISYMKIENLKHTVWIKTSNLYMEINYFMKGYFKYIYSI